MQSRKNMTSTRRENYIILLKLNYEYFMNFRLIYDVE